MTSHVEPSAKDTGYGLSDTWCATDFDSVHLNQFAQGVIEIETRRGLITMALLSLTVHIGVLLYGIILGRELLPQPGFVSTHVSLIFLSLHIAVSTRWLRDTKVLNLMGMALLVVTAAALMLMAHRFNSLTVSLIVGFAMLFMAMPIMTWGLKESLTVIAMVYMLLTASSISVEGRFDEATLWTLQFLIITSAVTALVLIARNVGIRKHDIRTRFELEKARSEMERLSNIDPLTGCWNRRFLDQRYGEIAAACAQDHRNLELALLDIDLFKSYNDTYGHHVGDQILCSLSRIMRQHLPGDAYQMRLGGDEFAVLFGGGGLSQMVQRCLNHLKTDPDLIAVLDGQSVTVSTGFASSTVDKACDLDELYQVADQDLYTAKRARAKHTGGSNRTITGVAEVLL